jgi:mRNA-degrading endonuclease RelE of RelBE toxin-antitoxin system
LKIEIGREALRALRRIQPARAQEIREAIGRVAAEPRAAYNNLRPLKGVPSGFCIWVGDWRVSYTLDWEADLMRIFEIVPRGGAYR